MATAIRTKGAPFKDYDVRAILDGRKTQTRRVVKLKNGDCMVSAPRSFQCYECDEGHYGFDSEDECYPCPYGQPGDELWVRETWRPLFDGEAGYIDYRAGGVVNAINGDHHNQIICARRALKNRMEMDNHWRPSIHMPRWASRITLEITDVRVERVQDISASDIVAEGACSPISTPRRYGCVTETFAHEQMERLWESVYGKTNYSWKSNP